MHCPLLPIEVQEKLQAWEVCDASANVLYIWIWGGKPYACSNKMRVMEILYYMGNNKNEDILKSTYLAYSGGTWYSAECSLNIVNNRGHNKLLSKFISHFLPDYQVIKAHIAALASLGWLKALEKVFGGT